MLAKRGGEIATPTESRLLTTHAQPNVSLPFAVTSQSATASGTHTCALTSGGWDSHVGGLPFNNFAIASDQGYFVKCAGSSSYTPGATPRSAQPQFYLLLPLLIK